MKKALYTADDRGFTNHKWLKSYHTFSFANYYDEKKSGFGKLLVLNEDTVQPDSGYGTHEHDNMEIISIPLAGGMTHKDNFGNEKTIRKGDVQVISAGNGITHTEYNTSKTEALHFLEIWVLPDRVNGEPNYQSKNFKFNYGSWSPIIRPDGRGGCMTIYQDLFLYLGRFRKNESLTSPLNQKHHGLFLMVIDGNIRISEEVLHQYDAIGMEDISSAQIHCLEDSDLLLIEVPMGDRK